MLTKQQRSKIHLRPLQLTQPKLYKQIEYLTSKITHEQKIYISLWLDSLLQPWSKKLLISLNKSQKLTILNLMDYIKKFYHHFDQIVIYYVIGCLMDLGWFNVDDDDKIKIIGKRKEQEQQISAKYFREHQWYTKIQHLNIYMIFPLLDPQMKGYVSINNLSHFISLHLDKHHNKSIQKKTTIIQKLKQNPSPTNFKINQQNLNELLQRLNLSNFIYFKQKIQLSQSETYQIIYKTIKHLQLRKDEQDLKDIRQIKKQREYNQILEYNQMIKKHAFQMCRNKDRKEYFQGGLGGKAGRFYDEDQHKFTFAQNQNQNQNNNQNFNRLKKDENVNNSNQIIHNNNQFTANPKDLINPPTQANYTKHLTLKNQILSQLNHIKTLKHQNKSKLAAYI